MRTEIHNVVDTMLDIFIEIDKFIKLLDMVEHHNRCVSVLRTKQLTLGLTYSEYKRYEHLNHISWGL